MIAQSPTILLTLYPFGVGFIVWCVWLTLSLGISTLPQHVRGNEGVGIVLGLNVWGIYTAGCVYRAGFGGQGQSLLGLVNLMS
jgi:hypothetical protein